MSNIAVSVANELKNKMKTVNLIFPHQLFIQSELVDNDHEIYLLEEYLFFSQYPFHKQKIAFHRASMKTYEKYLKGKGKKVHYIEASNPLSDIRNFDQEIREKKIGQIHLIDPTDDWLMKRIQGISKDLELTVFENKLFINSKKDLSSFFRKEKKSFFQTTFYKQQRKGYIFC